MGPARLDAVRKPESNLDEAPSALLVRSLDPVEVEGNSTTEEVESDFDTVEVANLFEEVSVDDEPKSDLAEVEVSLD